MAENIASFWYTPKGSKGMSKLEFLTMKSWLDHGFNFILYTYNLEDAKFKIFAENFKNFYLKDANEIVPFSDFFLDNRGGGVAAFSDYFRFKMIYQTGLPWADMDMVCLNQSSILDKDYLFIKEKGSDDIEYITTSLLKFPAGCDFGKMLIQKADEVIAGRKMVEWGCIGPEFLGKCVHQAGLQHYALGYQLACQIPWSKSRQFVQPAAGAVVLDKTQFCLHLYTEMWRIEGMSKNAVYPVGCIYANLLAWYNIDWLLSQIHYPVSFFDKYIFAKLFYLKARFKETKLYANLNKTKRIVRGGGKWIRRLFAGFIKRR